MKEYILTDLARFENPHFVSLAFVDPETGECFRPLPYFKDQQCVELDLRPGVRVMGDFSLAKRTIHPHVEDAVCRDLRPLGVLSAQEFQAVLDRTLCPSVEEGFGVAFRSGHYPIVEEGAGQRSFITIKVDPDCISVHEGRNDGGQVKISFKDGKGQFFRDVTISDRDFSEYVRRYQRELELDNVQHELLRQESIYLRLELGPFYLAATGEKVDGLRISGIYSFPDYLEEIRRYRNDEVLKCAGF